MCLLTRHIPEDVENARIIAICQRYKLSIHIAYTVTVHVGTDE